MWNNSPVRVCLAVLLLLTCGSAVIASGQETSGRAPQLLLTARHLKRLQRDRDRQTARWVNFEKRVQTVADSPERGFELALYYVVTRDPARGRQAIGWALGHKCEARQRALVLDWAANLISPQERADLSEAANCGPGISGVPPPLAVMLRDKLLQTIATDGASEAQVTTWNRQVFDNLSGARATDAETLYATAEYLMAARSVTGQDARRDDSRFFSLIPKEFLLSLKPAEVEHPSWRQHIAALALVNLDPNLEGSQFLQGWGLNDRQMLREGPGMAYEYLWADPYLPGIAYDNLDPWVYDPAGRLFARSSWDANGCWISISAGNFEQENCPPKVGTSASFGTLALKAATSSCTDLPKRKANEALILWKLKPHQPMRFEHAGQHSAGESDAAGLWEAPIDLAGKVCAVSGR